MFHVEHTRRKPEDGRRVRCVVYGAVQGVGFRYTIRQAARRLDIRGFVLNRPDGAVELEAAGAPDAIEELLRTARNGPPGSRVDRVEILDVSTDALPEPFAIRL